MTVYERIPSIYMSCPVCGEERMLVMVFDPLGRNTRKVDGRFYSKCRCAHREVLEALTEPGVALTAFWGARLADG